MNDLQKHTAKAIINIFETGKVRGRYGAVTVLKGDTGHLSYGRSQATLGSGSLYLLLQSYCQEPNAACGSRFVPLLPRFRDRDFSLDTDFGVHSLLEEAGEDPAMHQAQDRFFEETYWVPATRAAAGCGLTTPLSIAIVYDSHIQGGFRRMQKSVPAGLAERAWVAAFVSARKAWLAGGAPPLSDTVYRMNEFARLIEQSRWGLELPLLVRGVVINEEVLGAGEMRAVSARVAEPHMTSRILQLTRPYMRGEDVRALQSALQRHGFPGDSDGTFGPFTEVLVKQFQRKNLLKPDGIVGPRTWEELNEAPG